MKKFLNISNHNLTDIQKEDLIKMNFEVVELPLELKEKWSNLTPENYITVCNEVVDYMMKNEISTAHLSGFIPAVAYLKRVFYNQLDFYYSFSERVSEEKEINGTIVKTSKFLHKGWYSYI